MPRGHVCTHPGGVALQALGGNQWQCRHCGTTWEWDGENTTNERPSELSGAKDPPTALQARRAAQKAGGALTTTETMSASAGPAKKATKKTAKAKK